MPDIRHDLALRGLVNMGDWAGLKAQKTVVGYVVMYEEMSYAIGC